MIAVDFDLLVYAHREDAPWHDAAFRVVKELAEGKPAWSIPWPCVHEFLAVVTHPRIFDPPTPRETALDQVAAWLDSPSLVMLGEGPSYWPTLRELVEQGRIGGAQVHDARIAALCLEHGVRELLTVDRDFSRFRNLATRNPLGG